MARRRSKIHNGLPPNLNRFMRKLAGSEAWYYVYTNPITGKNSGFGYDRSEAVDAANQLNQLIGKGRALVDKVLEPGAAKIKVMVPGKSFSQFLTHFRDDILPGRRINGHPMSKHTLTEYRRMIRHLDEKFGNRSMPDITQGELAAYLNELSSSEVYNKYRSLLIVIYRHAVSEQVVPENLPEKIIKRDAEAKVRGRLTLDAYLAIFGKAPFAIQSALELSLNSLQRRTDIHAWRFDQQRDGHAYVIQSKTRKHGPSAYLAIPLALPCVHSDRRCKTLGEIIDSCRDTILSPFLVHWKPKRIKAGEKAHWTQLSPKQISDGFAEARDATGLFDSVPKEERPTYHELIALGAHLRLESGWAESQIQRLKGHTSVQMTKVYLEGHSWTKLEIPGVK